MALVRSRMPSISCLSRIVYGVSYCPSPVSVNQLGSGNGNGNGSPIGSADGKPVHWTKSRQFNDNNNASSTIHLNAGNKNSDHGHRDNGNKYKKTNHQRICQSGALSTFLLWLGIGKDPDDRRKHPDEDPDDPLLIAIKRAVMTFDRGDYNLAELQLHAALKMSQDEGNYLAQLTICDLLANNALVMENFDKARQLFTHVLKMLIALKEVDPSNDEQALELSAKIAVCYSKAGQFKEADEGFRFVISNLERRLTHSDPTSSNGDTGNGNHNHAVSGSPSVQNLLLIPPADLTPGQHNLIVLYAMILEWCAKHLTHKGDLRSAVDSYRRAIDLAVKYLPDGHPQLGILYNDISTVYTSLDDYPAGLACLERALRITKLYYNPNFLEDSMRRHHKTSPPPTSDEDFHDQLSQFQSTSYDLAVMHYNFARLLELDYQRLHPTTDRKNTGDDGQRISDPKTRTLIEQHLRQTLHYAGIVKDEKLIADATEKINKLTSTTQSTTTSGGGGGRKS